MRPERLIPSGPEQLTNPWLTDVLRQSGAVGAAAVSGHSWTSVAMQGAAGMVVRVMLEYDVHEIGAPATVIAKFASPHEPIRILINGFGLYRTEVEFYRQLGADPGIPTPRCFHADIDPPTGVFILLLEDMSDSRMGVGDQLALSIEDVELAIQYLAQFHAKWWGGERLREYDWLSYPGSAGFRARLTRVHESLTRSLPAVRQKFRGEFPAVLSTAIERVLANWDHLSERVTATPTLVHRDFHPQQLFFPSDRGGRFAVFDWQTVAIGRGADDLARIIGMGLSRSQRETDDRRLIALYHSCLLNHGVVGYEIGQCVLEFRLGLLSSLMINVVAAAHINLDLFTEAAAKAGVSIAYALFGRLAAAFEAHDVLSLLPAVAGG